MSAKESNKLIHMNKPMSNTRSTYSIVQRQLGLNDKMKKAMLGKVSPKPTSIISQNKRAINAASEINKQVKGKSGLKVNGSSSKSPLRAVTSKNKNTKRSLVES